jgi:L-asparaginase
MTILLITTGGTIGAMPYYEFKYSSNFVSTMPPKGQDFVRDAVGKIPGFKGRCISHEPRDSKLMDEAYRQGVLKIIEAAPEKKILTTHGTDTLLQSADYFYRQSRAKPALTDKIIMLTGSMIPLANGPESDGYLNLAFSLEQLKRLEAGKGESNIYIVLCDYERPEDKFSAWKPKLYPYQPGHYEKLYEEDRRYSRLIKAKSVSEA